MKRMLVSLFILIGLSAADAPDGSKWTVKAEKISLPKELADPIKGLLSEEAIRVEDGKGGTICTLWLRKEIPAKATEEQIKNGLTYREIAPTTLVGVVQFANTWIDFRKHEIPAGVYTLRLAIQPMDGDHMGTAPYNEFCLICPADKDTKAEIMEIKALHEMSGASHGSTHPAVMLLFPNSKPEEEPKWINKGNGIFVLNVKRAVATEKQKTTLGFGFTLAGVTTE